MQVFLKVVVGGHAGKEIAIGTDKFFIGRSDECQLRPKSESVSRVHCVIAIKDGRVLVQDLKSRNGTYVNDKRLDPEKAKVLKAGDALRVGKLSFEVVIKIPLGGTKKPQVKDVKDAASRTVQAGGTDSRLEDVDISSWLDEADQIDRVRRAAAPETRQLKLDETVPGSAESAELSTDTVKPAGSPAAAEEVAAAAGAKESKRPEKRKPGRLPKLPPGMQSADSREAADAALKKFFGGR